ncbi:MAG TPA: class I SAM-dependent methyltransferase [Thermoguttaceae bacterium]|nr:class I SAM-dependent methyltransferase [Thermoguttaceae bacterium]
MSTLSKPSWLHGLAVYQDVILNGQVAYPGSRDCRGAWDAMLPHLPRAGTVLDVGSNFGWFGLQLCDHSLEVVVASVEADDRSAAVQRRVLESNQATRICLLTARAGVGMARQFQTVGQRFDAVLCLAVLHWMADHRAFLTILGAMSRRLFIEHPDPAEEGAGVEQIRREIGQIGPYLKTLFPDRPVTLLAQLPSPRDSSLKRELWLVGEPSAWPEVPSPGLDGSALMGMSPSWPPRSWWTDRLGSCATGSQASHDPRILFSPGGLRPDSRQSGTDSLRRLTRLTRRIPEHHLHPPARRWYRRARRLGGQCLRALLPR